MLDAVEKAEEAFFDSVDCLSSEGSASDGEEPENGNFDYALWVSRPQSVQERRESFLRGMGFVQSGFKQVTTPGKSPEIVDSGRIMDSSGAVLKFRFSANGAEGSMVCSWEGDIEANSIVDELEDVNLSNINIHSKWNTLRGLSSACLKIHTGVKKLVRRRASTWWKRFAKRRSIWTPAVPKVNRMKVKQKKLKNKGCMEFTGLCTRQEIHGHNGRIWTMKFSPDGQYLASGGDDGVVRIWHVLSIDASCNSSTSEFSNKVKEDNSIFQRRDSCHAFVVIPEKVFWIEESPLQELRGHTSAVLDLAWSSCNHLLSSSKDKTVRLWQEGYNECYNVFCHNNYVTCVQFNPMDENFFITGCIDGKVRIWAIPESRVVDWVDVRDPVTAICYQPHGKGFVVGSIAGTCCLYESSGTHFPQGAQIHVQGKRKASGNMITGIQFSQQHPQRIMIASEDSTVRIYDGIDLVHQYRAPRKSGCQKSASFTSTGKHIVSVGEDSHVYVWNCDGSSGRFKSISLCDHFSSDALSIAIPWSSMGVQENCRGSPSGGGRNSQSFDDRIEPATLSQEAEFLSLDSWFSMDGKCNQSATWPVEKLPPWGPSSAKQLDHHHPQSLATSGLVIVAASWDGMIKTFHNYGLPVRIYGI